MLHMFVATTDTVVHKGKEEGAGLWKHVRVISHKQTFLWNKTIILKLLSPSENDKELIILLSETTTLTC